MNSVILLAAGKGIRMNTNIPKCIFPLLDKPLISYLIKTVKELDFFQNYLCVVGYQKDKVMNVVDSEVTFIEQIEQLGTGDAIKYCENNVDSEGFSLILNGDIPLIKKDTLNALIEKHIAEKNALTFLTTSLYNPRGYGRIIKENNNIVKICEEDELNDLESDICEVNLGVYVINNNVLFPLIKKIDNKNNKREFYFTDIVKLIANEHLKINAMYINDDFHVHGINDLTSLSIMEKAFSEEIKNNHLNNGVYLINKDSIIIGSDVKIKKGTIIHPNTIIYGDTLIGEDCIIGPNSEIKNTFIGDNVQVNHSKLIDCHIKNNSTVGPFAHLRNGTQIGENNRIGNFVEIKKSVIGNKTNVAHLTYIGDTISGENVNFGCGVITVNYDGINKHQTKIGNNVFIGCNSNLIAPIDIGDNVFIAAGSTITSSLEDNAFSIARSKQITKKDYSIKYLYKKD